MGSYKPGGTQNVKAKKKNALTVVLLIILVVLALALVIGVIGASTISKEDSSTPNASIGELDKENAARLDSAIDGMTKAAEKFYYDLVDNMTQLDSGTITLTDIYNNAVSAQENIQTLRTRIEEKSNTFCADYVEASSTYLSNCWAYADYIEKYIESQSQSDLENAKKTGQVLPSLALKYESARTAFLKSAGYSDSEIEAMN